MLDGESCIHYYEDARKRLLKTGARIIPNEGTQWASLISSSEFKKLLKLPISVVWTFQVSTV
eukprot:UN04320